MVSQFSSYGAESTNKTPILHHTVKSLSLSLSPSLSLSQPQRKTNSYSLHMSSQAEVFEMRFEEGGEERGFPSSSKDGIVWKTFLLLLPCLHFGKYWQ